ncbi:hypothetical protein [Chryseobacterium indoltheticum]
MSTKAFEVYRDFPFFFQEELDEIIQAHEKVVFQKRRNYSSGRQNG